MTKIIQTKDQLIKMYGIRTAIEFGVSHKDLYKRSRYRHIVAPRQMLQYLLRKHGFTLKHLAQIFNQDHTTVMHGIKTIKGLIEIGEYKTEYDNIWHGKTPMIEIDLRSKTPVKIVRA
jgi:chromosomal replication initiation ATPase DnaA